MKTCYVCKKSKAVTEYRVTGTYKGKKYLDRQCRECRNAYERNRYAKNPRRNPKKYWLEGKNQKQILELKRKRSIKRRYERYGLDIASLQKRLDAQFGHCATCYTVLTLDSSSKNEVIKPAHVDHDHKTGLVRGILCSKCNHALGLVNDDPDILKNMIEYLKDYAI